MFKHLIMSFLKKLIILNILVYLFVTFCCSNLIICQSNYLPCFSRGPQSTVNLAETVLYGAAAHSVEKKNRWQARNQSMEAF